MKAVFKRTKPYADDAMNLPVKDVKAAIPYYEKKFHFRVVSQQETPVRSAVLARDDIQIGVAENGGDPSQEGCFFEVDDVRAAFEELRGMPPNDSELEEQSFGEVKYLVFFEVSSGRVVLYDGRTLQSSKGQTRSVQPSDFGRTSGGQSSFSGGTDSAGGVTGGLRNAPAERSEFGLIGNKQSNRFGPR